MEYMYNNRIELRKEEKKTIKETRNQNAKKAREGHK
jgi:hypothetical protein